MVDDFSGGGLWRLMLVRVSGGHGDSDDPRHKIIWKEERERKWLYGMIVAGVSGDVQPDGDCPTR